MGKTLDQIIDDVQDNKKVSNEDLRYSILVLNSLLNLSSQSLRELHRGEILVKEGKKKKIIIHDPIYHSEENFRRSKQAMSMNPRDYLGWDNLPENPEYRKRIKTGRKLIDKIYKEGREE